LAIFGFTGYGGILIGKSYSSVLASGFSENSREQKIALLKPVIRKTFFSKETLLKTPKGVEGKLHTDGVVV